MIHFKRKSQTGYTLIEVIVVMIITGIIAAILGQVLQKGFDHYFYGKTLSELSAKGNLALTMMNRELASAYSITAASNTSITFVDINGNTIVYAYDNGVLTRKQNSDSAYAILNQIGSSGFTFARFDASGATTTTAANIRLVQANLTMQNDKETYRLITAVFLRNR